MRWTRGKRSANLEDRRGGRRPMSRGAKAGLGGSGVVVLILALVFGPDVLQGGGPAAVNVGAGGGAAGSGPPPLQNDEMGQFVSFVLDDTEATWTKVFRTQLDGPRYRAPKLVLFEGQTSSGCGYGDAATGPFYCPADEKVYLDLSFFSDLKRRFGAPGDFAQAYVIGHEVGHHIQTVLGISRQVHDLRSRSSKREGNALSVMQELQADCFAGVWAHETGKRNLLERGDIEEGLRAAAAIGDDRLQKQAGGRVAPESWTHGSSAQRMRWFKRGFDTGKVSECDTFSATSL